MTQTDYKNKRRECWEEFKRQNLDGEVQWQPVSRYDVFCAAFDRAYALGKQEKDTEKISSLEEEIHTYAKMCSFTEADYKVIRKAVEHGISLAKSDTEDTVIQGWVARDNGGFISLFSYHPDRVIHDDLGFWGRGDDSNEIDLPKSSFPDLTWESEPQEVEIIIKRKKK